MRSCCKPCKRASVIALRITPRGPRRTCHCVCLENDSLLSLDQFPCLLLPRSCTFSECLTKNERNPLTGWPHRFPISIFSEFNSFWFLITFFTLYTLHTTHTHFLSCTHIHGPVDFNPLFYEPIAWVSVCLLKYLHR